MGFIGYTNWAPGRQLNYGVHMDDSELVAAITAGDPAGLAAAYDTYAAPLYGYCRWMLRDPGSAAEALRETFVLATARAGYLRDASQLRALLYASAREECYRRDRAAGAGFEETANEFGPLGGSGPFADSAHHAEQAEVRRLIRETLAELKPHEQEVLELSVRHKLDEAELATVLDVTWSRAHGLASRAREHLEKALGALLVARTGRSSCPELSALLAPWIGRLTVQTGKLTAQHIEQCETCAHRRRGTLRLEVLSGLLPLAALPPGLREPVLLRVAASVAETPRRPLIRPAPEPVTVVDLAPVAEPVAAVEPVAAAKAATVVDLPPVAEPATVVDLPPVAEQVSGTEPDAPGFRGAGSFLGWSRIRANPGTATAVAAVTVWVVAAVTATLITLSGVHPVRALAAQTHSAAAPSIVPTASSGAPASPSPRASRSRKPATQPTLRQVSTFRPTPTPTRSVKPSPSKSASLSPSASPSASSSPSPTPTHSHTPTPTPTPSPSST